LPLGLAGLPSVRQVGLAGLHLPLEVLRVVALAARDLHLPDRGEAGLLVARDGAGAVQLVQLSVADVPVLPGPEVLHPGLRLVPGAHRPLLECRGLGLADLAAAGRTGILPPA